jgi:transcription antitermination factor NusG
MKLRDNLIDEYRNLGKEIYEHEKAIIALSKQRKRLITGISLTFKIGQHVKVIGDISFDKVDGNITEIHDSKITLNTGFTVFKLSPLEIEPMIDGE